MAKLLKLSSKDQVRVWLGHIQDRIQDVDRELTLGSLVEAMGELERVMMIADVARDLVVVMEREQRRREME